MLSCLDFISGANGPLFSIRIYTSGTIDVFICLCPHSLFAFAVPPIRWFLFDQPGGNSICTGEALKSLHSEEPDEALTLLRKAEILSANTRSANGMHSL